MRLAPRPRAHYSVTMRNSYEAYLRRFAASRGGRVVGKFTVSNGQLVPLLSRDGFERRWRDLSERMLDHRHLVRRDHTVPIELEGVLDKLLAELLLPIDFHPGEGERLANRST